MLYLFLCLLLAWARAAESSPPFVELLQGRAEGRLETTFGGRQVATFWSLPYAKPPAGKLRFKEPMAAGPWQGVLNATRPPPECLQYSHFDMKGPRPVFGQEDCLYLNVFTPLVDVSVGMEVVVYIHGGAFMYHSSKYYGHRLLLDRDIVMVTINYRLGPLGFLSTGDSVVPGNNGLKDQALALRWVRDNIRAFGGDPDKVTIAGLSAGSSSVHYHLLSPLSQGLFQRAIMVSGSSLTPWSLVERLPQKTAALAASLGCPTNDSYLTVRCLRDRPAEHIVSLASLFQGYLYNPFSPFGPTVEVDGPNAFLAQSPQHILEAGLAHDVPILASYTSAEGLYPGAELVKKDNLPYLKENLRQVLPHILDYNWTLPLDRQAEVADRIIKEYQIDLTTDQGIQNFVTMLGDRLFVAGIVKAVKLHATTSTAPVYAYRFSYRGDFSSSSVFGDRHFDGVSHGDDLFYVVSLPSLSRSQETDADRAMSRYMVDLWADFAKNGSLSGGWRPLEAGELQELKGPALLENLADPDPGRVAFWEELDLDGHLSLRPKDEL